MDNADDQTMSEGAMPCTWPNTKSWSHRVKIQRVVGRKLTNGVAGKHGDGTASVLQREWDRRQEAREGGGTKMEGRIEKHTMSSGQDIKRETNTPLQDSKGSADRLECTRAHTHGHHAACSVISFRRSSHSWNNQNTRMRSAANSIFSTQKVFLHSLQRGRHAKERNPH